MLSWIKKENKLTPRQHMCTPHTGRAWNYANTYGTEFRRETTFYGCFCLHLREHRKICDEKQKIWDVYKHTMKKQQTLRRQHVQITERLTYFGSHLFASFDRRMNKTKIWTTTSTTQCQFDAYERLHVYYFFAAFYWFSTDFSARIRYSRTFIGIVVLMISTRLLSTSHLISGTILLPSQTWTKINC